MQTDFKSLLKRVESQFAQLCSTPPRDVYEEPYRGHILKKAGVYVLYEAAEPLYVGRTRDLWRRLGEHSLPSSDGYAATFAIVLARKKTGISASYKKETGVKYLVANDQRFADEFRVAKSRVHDMQVRWVEAPDADCRCLLEFYAAKELQTPFNDFSET